MYRALLLQCISLALIGLVSCETTRPIEKAREVGDRHFQRAEYQQASREYGEIVQRKPGDWRAQYRYGLTMLELGRYREANRALQYVYTERPDDPDVADALAEAIHGLGDQRQLFQFLDNRANDTHTARSHLRLAKYAMEYDDADTAQSAIRTAIALDEGRSAEPYLIAARLASRLGDNELAIRRLRQAYSIAPNDQRVNRRLRELGEVPGPSRALPPGP